MKITVTNKEGRSVAQTYERVINCSVQTYANLDYKPHWVLELHGKPGNLFPTATFPCSDWDIDVTD